MSRPLQDAIRAIWGVLLLVPMPWRAGFVIGIVAIGGYQALRRLLPLLLLPEFWITNQLRRLGRRPLPGTYAFGDFIGWTIKASRWMVWAGVMVAGAGITSWYVRPSLEDTTLARYIDQSVTWWYSLEGWALTGEWALPAYATPPGGSRSSFSNPARSTATPALTVTPRANALPTRKPTRIPTLTSRYTIYIVQPGDSLSKIAKWFGVSVEDLVKANQSKYPSLITDPDSVEVGWQLRIPLRLPR